MGLVGVQLGAMEDAWAARKDSATTLQGSAKRYRCRPIPSGFACWGWGWRLALSWLVVARVHRCISTLMRASVCRDSIATSLEGEQTFAAALEAFDASAEHPAEASTAQYHTALRCGARDGNGPLTLCTPSPCFIPSRPVRLVLAPPQKVVLAHAHGAERSEAHAGSWPTCTTLCEPKWTRFCVAA